MNSKIKELKILNFKLKIRNYYDFINLKDILYGEKMDVYIHFLKSKSIENDVNRTSFYFYDEKVNTRIYNEKYSEALDYFIKKLNYFSIEDEIVFPILFNKEYFGLLMAFEELLLNFNLIIDKAENKDFFVIENKMSRILSLDTLEYCIEVFEWNL